MVRTVLASSTIDPGSPERSESTWTSCWCGAVGGDDELDDAGPGAGRRVEHGDARVGHGESEGFHRPVGQAGGDGSGLGVPVQHGVDHIVHRAGADGVVRGIAHHLPPGQLQEARGVGRGWLEERGQGLGSPLQLTLRHRALALHVHAIRGDAHEHVGPEPRAQLALDHRQALAGPGGQVLRQRGHLEVEVVLQVVRLGDDPPELRLGHQVVRPVHAEEVAGDEVPDLVQVVGGPAHERLGVVGQRGAVAVADRQVLGPHGRSVRRLPDEGVPGHLGRHATPHHGVVEAGEAQDLGHLRNVPEHVGQVADVHDAAERGPPLNAHLQVAHDGLARGEELVHEDVPRAHAQPAGGRQRPQPLLGLGTHLEVVVDDRHLPVEHEVGVAGVLLEEGEQVVDQLDEGEAEVLIGLVPFPVPVRVRNDDNPSGGHDRQTMTSGRGR